MSKRYIKYGTIKSDKKINVRFFQKISKFNNLIMIKFMLFFIYNIIVSYCFYINIKVNDIGNQQIFSDDFNIELYKPNKILVNSDGQILREKKVYVYTINDNIKIEWNYLKENLSYMFSNIESITSIKFDSESTRAINM